MTSDVTHHRLTTLTTSPFHCDLTYLIFLSTFASSTTMDLQKRINFNQFIKEKINERILKRKILKSKLLKLNSMRNLTERLISNHHQNLYYMGLKLDDPTYEEKVNNLSDPMKEKAHFYRCQIYDLSKQMKTLLDEIKSTFLEYSKL